MQKTSQRMGLINKLRELTNSDGTFNEFGELMEKLRKADDQTRAIVLGEPIGEYYPKDSKSLKELLKSAKSNFNRREYMLAVSDLGDFHKRVDEVVKSLGTLEMDIAKIHSDFLLGGVDPEVIKYLKEDLGVRFPKKASSVDEIIKSAGILDYFTSMFTERGRALKAMEKRFPTRFKELKNKTKILIDSSLGMLSVLLNSLKKMATARATRKVDDYFTQISVIIKRYSDYNEGFKDYYNTQVRDFLEKVVKTEVSSPSTSTNNPSEMGSQDIGNPASTPVATTSTPVATTSTPTSTPVAPAKSPVVPAVQPALPVAPGLDLSTLSDDDLLLRQRSLSADIAQLNITLNNSPPAQKREIQENIDKIKGQKNLVKNEIDKRKSAAQITKTQSKFLNSIEKMSNESPIILAGYIHKYAKLIEKSDPETANKLYNIVNSIVEG